MAGPDFKKLVGCLGNFPRNGVEHGQIRNCSCTVMSFLARHLCWCSNFQNGSGARLTDVGCPLYMTEPVVIRWQLKQVELLKTVLAAEISMNHRISFCNKLDE